MPPARPSSPRLDRGTRPLHGFKGLAQDVGPNPAVKLLRDALEERVGYEKARGGPSTAPLVKPLIFRTRQAGEGWKVSEGQAAVLR